MAKSSTTIELENGWKLKTVIVDNKIQLIDMFTKKGVWHGSRRTIQQCRQYIDQQS